MIYARALSVELRHSVGIERMSDPLNGKGSVVYSVKLLPGKKHRQGYELRCEVIEYEVLN